MSEETQDKKNVSDKALRDAMNLLCEYAESKLPPGYLLKLEITSDESTLSLEDDFGGDVEFEGGFSEAIMEARDCAAMEIGSDEEE